MRSTFLARVLLATAFLVAPSLAHAQSSSNEQVAQTLFDAARAHLDAGDIPRACAELEQSYKLDAAGGTLLNLAFCHERLGKFATALSEYKDALAQGKRDGRADRVKTALKRISDLESRVPRWIILAPPGNYDALAITIDGAPYAFDVLGADTPFDPGAHAIHVTATGRVPYDAKVVARESARDRITIPALVSDGTMAAPAGAPLAPLPSSPAPPTPIENAPPPPAPSSGIASKAPPASPPPSVQADSSSSFKAPAYGFFIGSGALLVTSAIFGGIASSDSSKVSGACIKSRDYCRDQSSVDTVNEMRTFAIVSSVALGAGVVAAGVGWFWPRNKTWITADFRGNSFVLSGQFD